LVNERLTGAGGVYGCRQRADPRDRRAPSAAAVSCPSCAGSELQDVGDVLRDLVAGPVTGGDEVFGGGVECGGVRVVRDAPRGYATGASIAENTKVG
jgi:hypothetical protein